MVLTLSLLSGGLVMIVSLAGILFTKGSFGAWMSHRIGYLTSFATGVIALLVFHLVQESLEESSMPVASLVALVGGFVAMELIHYFLPAHDHCEDEHDHSLESSHAHTPIDGRRVLISDAVHNISDGFVLVLAFGVSFGAGLVATLAIMAHEAVQEISEFFVLKEAGYTDREALTRNFIASSTILIGIILAYAFSEHELLVALLGACAAGGFLSVLVRDLLPHFVSEVRHGNGRTAHVLALALGCLLMYSVTTLAPHEHHDEVESNHVSLVR